MLPVSSTVLMLDMHWCLCHCFADLLAVTIAVMAAVEQTMAFQSWGVSLPNHLVHDGIF
jgi:hypothetical protein